MIFIFHAFLSIALITLLLVDFILLLNAIDEVFKSIGDIVNCGMQKYRVIDLIKNILYLFLVIFVMVSLFFLAAYEVNKSLRNSNGQSQLIISTEVN